MPDVFRRDRELANLAPSFRGRVQRLLERLASEELPFRMFEAFRTPVRQDWLYQQGRTRPGSVVTKARAWESYHQYGLAADFVLWLDGRWSWDAAGERASWWKRLHKLGRALELEPVSFEMPHLQQAGLKLADLKAGRLPETGDESWWDTLEAAAAGWTGTPPSPVLPLPVARPPLATHSRPVRSRRAARKPSRRRSRRSR